MEKWAAADIPDLSGKRAIVTGANTGVGFHSALELARHGAHVVLACRDAARGGRALEQIRRAAPGAAAELMILDVADLASVREFAEDYRSRHPGLDVLINNAGVMATPYRRTADGFELQFATNYLGHFALTGRLLGPLLAVPAARVVNITTFGVKYWGSIDFDNLHGEKKYNKNKAYVQAKMANLVFTKELARRFAGTGLVSAAAHPGYAVSDVLYVGPRMEGSRLKERYYKVTTALVAKPTSEGALPFLYAACAPDVRPGESYGPRGPGQIRGRTGWIKSPAAADDRELGRRLWRVSERLTGVSFDPLPSTHA